MRAGRLASIALLAVAGVAGAAPDAESTLRARVQQLVEMIATGDEGSRAAAADELVKLGRPAVPHVGRHAHLLSSPTHRETVTSAFARIGLDDAIAILMSHPPLWSPKSAEPVRELVAAMRARRDPKLAATVELVPTDAKVAARVPPDAELVIEEKLPEALAWGDHAVRRGKAGLLVDVEGQGARFESVELDEPRCLRVGARRRPLLVYWRLDRWYAASGALLAGKLRGQDVELWDADLDGVFTGAKDFVRFGDGAFQRMPQKGIVEGPSGLAMMTVRATATGACATFVPEPMPPDVGEWAIWTLDAVDDFRRSVALPPVLLNLPRCACCAKHVEYWRQNGYSGHEEAPDHPGFSTDGGQAGKRSSVSDDADPANLARVISATVLHRATLLGATAEGLGVASSPGSCVWGGDVDSSSRGFPVLVPGPGQDTVPPTCEVEQPPPDRLPGFYASPRGYPVTVLWRGSWDDVKNARLELFLVGPGAPPQPIPGELFEPDHPYDSKGRLIELGAATFVAGRPLERRKSYVARFRCERDAGPAEFTWTFATR